MTPYHLPIHYPKSSTIRVFWVKIYFHLFPQILFAFFAMQFLWQSLRSVLKNKICGKVLLSNYDWISNFDIVVIISIFVVVSLGILFDVMEQQHLNHRFDDWQYQISNTSMTVTDLFLNSDSFYNCIPYFSNESSN